MKVDLTNEAVDGLMKSILIQDYNSLCADIRRLEDNQDKLKKYQLEDLKNNIRYRDAMEVMMEYYVSMNWKNEI